MHLPPELWRRILQESAVPSGGLITSWDYSPSEKLFQGWEEIDFEDTEIETKRSIVLVCRQWRALGTEFLYQWIQLKSPNQAMALSKIFRASQMSESPIINEIDSVSPGFEDGSLGEDEEERHRQLALTYGWWVRRVDIHTTLIVDPGMIALFNFLEQCARVEVVFHTPPFASVTDDISLRLSYFEASRFRNSLRHLSMRTRRSPFTIPVPLLTTLTTLTSLSLAIMRGMQCLVPNWHLPSLRFLKLLGIYELSVPDVFPFIQKHGPQLIGLHLRAFDNITSLPSILAQTTSLRSLVLNQEDLTALSDQGNDEQLSFPSISHLGIQGIDPEMAEEPYSDEGIAESIETILSNQMLPGLKVVRLLAVDDPPLLQTRWPELHTLCHSQGLVLGGKD